MNRLARAFAWLRGHRGRKAGHGRAEATIATRATILAEVDDPAETAMAEAWLEGARDRLSTVSNQLGCGCCILMWDVEGPAELIASIPLAIRCDSEWTRNPSSPLRLH